METFPSYISNSDENNVISKIPVEDYLEQTLKDPPPILKKSIAKTKKNGVNSVKNWPKSQRAVIKKPNSIQKSQNNRNSRSSKTTKQNKSINSRKPPSKLKSKGIKTSKPRRIVSDSDYSKPSSDERESSSTSSDLISSSETSDSSDSDLEVMGKRRTHSKRRIGHKRVASKKRRRTSTKKRTYPIKTRNSTRPRRRSR